MAILRSSAAELGDALLAAADNNTLWEALAPTPIDGISDDDKRHLRTALAEAAVGINWSEFLGRIGHQPPPDAQTYGEAFAEAITRGSDGDFDIATFRRRLREFGNRLNALSADPNATVTKVRRGIWKGLRVGGSMVVAAAASVAISIVLTPIVGPLGIAIGTAALIPAEKVTEFGVEVCKDAITRVADKFRKDKHHHRVDDPVPHEPALKALATIDKIPEDRLLGLRRAWINPLGTETAATYRFISDTQRRVHEALGAGSGTTWLSPDTRQRCQELIRDLDGLKDLIRQSQPNRAEVIKAICTVAADIPILKAQIRKDVVPPEPDEVRQAVTERRNKFIDDLRVDINTSRDRTAKAKEKLRLNALAQSRKPRIIRDADEVTPDDIPVPRDSVDTNSVAIADSEHERAVLAPYEAVTTALDVVLAEANRRPPDAHG